MIITPTIVRVLTLVSGVIGIILPNVGLFSLPASVQGIITAVGGVLLAVLAWLEHPTTVNNKKGT